ncbi:MAG: hypothetical protein ACE5EX_12770, partial [Phycisphaerae bacterium]
MTGACPADSLEPNGTVCRASTGGCDPAEACDGVSVTCPADAISPVGTVCRASTDECDPQETCDGVATACPADAFTPNGTTCTDDAQLCTSDFCQSGLCIHPVQVFGTVCRASSGPCDPQEVCDGSLATCPADSLNPAGTVCRASAGLCDPQEVCDGLVAACPADAREAAGFVCRASTDECDPQETCDGVAALCPSDTLLPNGTPCTDDGFLCSDDTCQVGFCSHPLKAAGVVCRASTDECDPQETCDGIVLSCPADAFSADGTACTSDGSLCTIDDCQTGVCSHTDTTPAGQCCDPGTGGLTTIDDANVCTTDVCNPDGTVNHDPAGAITVNLKAEALAAAVTRDVQFVITTRIVPVTFDAFGQATLTLNSVDAVASWISVAEAHTLRRLEPLSITACSGNVDLSGVRLLPTGDLQTGTVLQDNLCDITDFSILASAWNVPIGANLTTGGDATGDGTQGTADFTAIQVNFFTIGETQQTT